MSARVMCTNCGEITSTDGAVCPDCAEAHEQAHRDEIAELRRQNAELAALQDEDLWDQHAVNCGNCSVEIIARNGSALSDDGGGEDEHLCGHCAGEQMYIYMEEIDKLRQGQAAHDAEIRRKAFEECAEIVGCKRCAEAIRREGAKQ